jgi:hypothetical protein
MGKVFSGRSGIHFHGWQVQGHFSGMRFLPPFRA